MHDTAVVNVSGSTPRVERRRPGRVERVSPALLPLLRGEAVWSPDDRDHRQHDLMPATGIAVGVLLSAPMWALIFWVVWWISHVA
jgi:hypothetical protein